MLYLLNKINLKISHFPHLWNNWSCIVKIGVYLILVQFLSGNSFIYDSLFRLPVVYLIFLQNDSFHEDFQI